MLASEFLAERRETCRIYETDHGSDHRAIETWLDLIITREAEKTGRRLFQKTDWATVRVEL